MKSRLMRCVWLGLSLSFAVISAVPLVKAMQFDGPVNAIGAIAVPGGVGAGGSSFGGSHNEHQLFSNSYSVFSGGLVLGFHCRARPVATKWRVMAIETTCSP